MEQTAFKILIADDNEIILEGLRDMFDSAGFTVVAARDGQEAIDLTLTEHPDLIMLDYHMPRKDGFEAVAEIRKYPSYTNIPIIILTSDDEKRTKMEGFSLEIDDFLTKPADEDVIIARVKLLIKRSLQRMDCNPLTKLPGNPSIQARVERELGQNNKFAVIYADLNNFKAYNDIYGFEAGDKVLLMTAKVLESCALKYDKDAFIGNIGGDDFICVCKFEAAQQITLNIINAIEKSIPDFYNTEDKTNGYIYAKNRRGVMEQFPLMSISLAVVHNGIKPLSSYAQVAGIATELKHFAKTKPGSFTAFDRRA